jgi:hypothetical protein
VVDVIEGRDAPADVRRIHEVGTNWIVFRRATCSRRFPASIAGTVLKEYYLNRAISLMLDDGARVDAVVCDTGGTLGLNSRGGLAAVTEVVRRRINERHLDAGVTLIDPAATYIDVDARIGPDTTIYPNTFVEGATAIGAKCIDRTIHPSARCHDRGSDRGSRSRSSRDRRSVGTPTLARSHGSGTGSSSPTAPTIGNFVEAKATRVGRGSKAKHLHVPRGRGDRGRRERRRRHGDGQLRRVPEAPDPDRRWGEHRFGYDVGRADNGRTECDHRSRFGDHEGRAAGSARGGAGGTTDGSRVPGSQRRGAPPRGREGKRRR